jgi:chaperonin GroEL
MKKVLFGEEAREKIMSGVRKITQAVAATLGPRGRVVLISEGFVNGAEIVRPPIKATKDGVTVARAFTLGDHLENIGVELIKEAAQKTVGDAGDATTTTCVLAEAMIEKGIQFVNQPSSHSPVEVKKGMDAAVKAAIDELSKMSTPIAGNVERIKQVATVSSNNDESIGQLLADAYSKVGDDGLIQIEDAKGIETKLRLTEGFSFDRGYISQHFIRDWSKANCVFPDESAPTSPFVLLHDRPITTVKSISPLMEKVHKAQRPLLIIAPDVDGEALAYLAINNQKKALAVCAVKAPFVGERLNEVMEDIAALTGAKYISQLAGIKLENVAIEHLGEAEKVVVTKDATAIIGGRKDESRKAELVKRLQDAKKEAKDDTEKYAIEERLARLNGAVAVIEVGGNTEIEQKEKKDRIEDAVLSVKAAIQDGYSVGGGTALLMARSRLSYDLSKSADFRAGQEVVYTAMERPFLKICENAGVDGNKKLTEVLLSSAVNVGYNAQTENVEDLVQSGIIDATKVIKYALTNAASVAGVLVMSECLICDTF